MNAHESLLFALQGSQALGDLIARQLDIPLHLPEEREFSGREHKIRALVPVEGKRIYVVHSLNADEQHSVNDKLCRLLFFIGSLKDAGASSVNVIVPYLAYARKDRRTKFQDPVTTRYVADLFVAVGVDSVTTMDVHNLAAFENAFQCATKNLSAMELFVDYFAARLNKQTVSVVAPDVGAIKAAENFRQQLRSKMGTEVDAAFITKQRSRDIVTSSALHGDVDKRHVIIFDDMIDSGTTVGNAMRACRQGGAEKIYAAATHGVFSEQAATLFETAALTQIVITNTVEVGPDFSTIATDKLAVLDSAPLFARSIDGLA